MRARSRHRGARAFAAGLALAAIFAAPAARADDTDACLSASDSGQKERDNGHLLEARKQLLLCSRDVCPRIVRSDCGKWASDVQDRIPTVIFGARDAQGGDLVDVTVEMDGNPVARKLDGRPFPVDPGEHRLRFTHEGSPPIEQTAVVREREKGRAIVVQFGGADNKSEEQPPAPAPEKGHSILPYVVGGVGVIAIGSFAYFGISGSTDASNLRSTCAPHCSDSSVSDVKRKLLIADISLGVGVVSLGVAGALLLFGGHHEETEHPAPVSLDVVPVAGGQVATLRGSF
jgi:hypothetical protein